MSTLTASTIAQSLAPWPPVHSRATYIILDPEEYVKKVKVACSGMYQKFNAKQRKVDNLPEKAIPPTMNQDEDTHMASDEELLASSGSCVSSDEATNIHCHSMISPGLRLILTPGPLMALTLLQNRELTDPAPLSTIAAAVSNPQSMMVVSFIEAFDHMWIEQPGDQGTQHEGE
ncbi:hypothetical protein BDZ97DRAFT_1917223 [Flammula alnicola]|nr:hypothetical protein BDZ97DRAFT_1917223 [Flammula alnicola]